MEHVKPGAPRFACLRSRCNGAGQAGRAGRHARVLAAILACLAPTAAGQQIYKWVDDRGVTQYTKTPPPGGKAQAIRANPASGKPATEPKSWKEQEIEFRARQVERAEAEQAENRTKREATLRRESCTDAHRNLQALQKERPVYALNEKGERQYLDDAQRSAAARRTREFIDRECRQ